MTLNAGDFYDGNIFSVELKANFKLGSRFTMNLLLDRNNVKLSAGNFCTTVVGTRILHTFTPRLFAKTFIQWNSEKQAIIANFLVHFIHRPGSDLFFVYNEELNREKNIFESENRALLFKVTYLLHI